MPARLGLGRWLRGLAGVAIFLALLALLARERQAFASFGGLSPGHVGWILVGTLGAWASNVAATRLLLGMHGRAPSFGELWLLHTGAGLLNHLPLRAGLALRALYFRRRTQLPWSAVGSVLALQTVIQVAAAGLVGALATLPSGPIGLVAAFALLAVAPALLVALPWRPFRSQSVWGEKFNRLLAEMERIRGRWPRLLAVTGLGAVGALCSGLRIWAAFDALGSSVGLREAAVVGASGPLTLLAAITPAGVGVTEFLTMGLGRLVGVGASEGLVAATLVRVVITACFIVVGTPALWVMRKRFGDGT